MVRGIALQYRLANNFLLAIFFLAPTYVVSMRQTGTEFIGVISGFMSLFKPFWWLSLCLILMLLLLCLRSMAAKMWCALCVVVWSLFISYVKFFLGVYDSAQPGIVWSLIFFLVYLIPPQLASRTIYIGIAYLSVVNLVFSLGQLLVGIHILEPAVVPLASYQGVGIGYGFYRATGIFNTPLALGCFGVFATFALLGLKHWSGKFYAFCLLCSCLLPTFAVAKSAIVVLALFSVYTFLFNRSWIGRKFSNGIIVVVCFAFIVFGGILLVAWGENTHTYSAFHKPAAIISFFLTIFENPQVLLWGFTNHTSILFQNNFMEILPSVRHFSFESWLLRLIVYYGGFYFVMFIWMAIKSIKCADSPFRRWYIGCAFASLVVASLVSNGGAQPPTSFLFFALAGNILAYHRAHVV